MVAKGYTKQSLVALKTERSFTILTSSSLFYCMLGYKQIKRYQFCMCTLVEGSAWVTDGEQGDARMMEVKCE